MTQQHPRHRLRAGAGQRPARNKFHNGGRLRFGPDASCTPAPATRRTRTTRRTATASTARCCGSTGRQRPVGQPVQQLRLDYGHRNVQGLAFDSQGRLWEQEFGDSHRTETNLIQRGGNYGWPNCEGTFSRSGAGCGQSGFSRRATYPVADCSCSGLTIVTTSFTSPPARHPAVAAGDQRKRGPQRTVFSRAPTAAAHGSSRRRRRPVDGHLERRRQDSPSRTTATTCSCTSNWAVSAARRPVVHCGRRAAAAPPQSPSMCFAAGSTREWSACRDPPSARTAARRAGVNLRGRAIRCS